MYIEEINKTNLIDLAIPLPQQIVQYWKFFDVLDHLLYTLSVEKIANIPTSLLFLSPVISKAAWFRTLTLDTRLI